MKAKLLLDPSLYEAEKERERRESGGGGGE
jgi:hypothetical protein